MYCTMARLIELFGEVEMLELSNLHDPAATVVDAVRIQAAIMWASEEINSYIGFRYALPLTTIPYVLESKAADMARYQLDSLQPREDVRQRYEDALRWLKLVGDGKASLGVGLDAATGTVVEIANNDLNVGSLIPDATFDLGGY
jgi:phage gp36-like protein